MAGTRAAIRYAKAVLALAGEQDATTAVYEDMQLIKNTVAASRELQLMLKSPVVKPEVKRSALKEIFASIHKISADLINILAGNNRIGLLKEVAGQYVAVYDEAHGRQVAIVTTAVPLTDRLKAGMLQKVKELTGKEATLKNIIDESIIGGFILRVGDLQYNASVANRFNSLRRTFSLN
ncbi:ATP synthase F1 subunit delta [Sinomicrobium weinanense]|uniref:ATP synthase subunit delta n=1 Tax=Sinomicrobium weinanense TaxID=2842200 RepID=A0A926JTE2_9FLAO|nr:ATP synthase F1 subunit delta [Sinomicrobium weinanense]MBC9796923.1 ATP synthase F1 subunit delta [Sinomicrobium weinanense]MBU3124231.1 ATP synthase F1 subunit delta [Sinomicrobium weinanense]